MSDESKLAEAVADLLEALKMMTNALLGFAACVFGALEEWKRAKRVQWRLN